MGIGKNDIHKFSWESDSVCIWKVFKGDVGYDIPCKAGHLQSTTMVLW